MPNVMQTQDNFTQGELSPLMYAKASVGNYSDSLRIAQNVLSKPQGAAGKRFGTLYQATLSGFTDANNMQLAIFQYANEATYQLIFYQNTIEIYLEGIKIATVTDTFSTFEIQNMDFTTLGVQFVMAFVGGRRPQVLSRSPDDGNLILAASGTQLTLNTAITPGLIVPIQLSIGGTIVSTPQVIASNTYFAYQVDINHVELYLTSQDAKARLNPISFTSISGTNNLLTFNSWALSNYFFRAFPVFDFNQNYDTIIFTPASVYNDNLQITANSPIFKTALIGGIFAGNGGLIRITSVTSPTILNGASLLAFANTTPISGIAALLAEPVWSDGRGWPSKVSSYQNRAIFANSASLHNGLWLSVINDYTSFDDSQTDDDNAISWYPTSDNITYINFIVPYRSLTIHTNSGVYSSPLSANNAITPSNFALLLNDGAPADKLKPRAIDNQIIVSSGNDVYSLLWDGINNAYTSQLVSVVNEQVIRNPTDEATFLNLIKGSGRYVFIVNETGSLAIYQTLITENLSGWTPNVTEQSYGNSYFRAVDSSFGRAWFVTERNIATATNTYNIIGFTSDSLQSSIATDLSTTEPTAITFATAGSLPASTPQITTTQYYYAIAVDLDKIAVYSNITDAMNGENAIQFTSAGTSSTFTEWPAQQQFFLEELSFDVFLDCAVAYNGSPVSTISGMPQFNAQDVKMQGDGFGFDAVGFNNSVEFLAHGVPQAVSKAFIGFPINTIIEPLPIVTVVGGPHNNNLTRRKHVRSINFIFNNTIGGTINGVPIAINTFDNANIGSRPIPASGIFELGVLNGWNDYNVPNFTLLHNEPFDMQLLGLFYYVDV